MFRRRPAKRSAPGFARTREDITALGDTIGEMLTSPVRDAPPIARDAPLPKPHAPRTEKPRPHHAKTNGGGAPQLAPRAGYLAVHSLEKSFGTRQVVRGVSIYVRRGEAVGLLGPNGAGKTTVFYMITGLIKADRGTIELDGHDVTKLPMYQRARKRRPLRCRAASAAASRSHGPLPPAPITCCSTNRSPVSIRLR